MTLWRKSLVAAVALLPGLLLVLSVSRVIADPCNEKMRTDQNFCNAHYPMTAKCSYYNLENCHLAEGTDDQNGNVWYLACTDTPGIPSNHCVVIPEDKDLDCKQKYECQWNFETDECTVGAEIENSFFTTDRTSSPSCNPNPGT
jgi:hypothetical protein